MLTWKQWQEKSRSSLEASRILLENQKPVEAASRAYYAAYQMVTTVLIKFKLSPRGEFGNWSHDDTFEMYRTHICQKADLQYKEKVALTKLRLSYRTLLITRYKADYSLDKDIDVSSAQTLWRYANQFLKLLENLVKRGVL
ncbi:MAG: hypothetical protein ACREOI_07230 [bacterium]